jgi:hypothetical protein
LPLAELFDGIVLLDNLFSSLVQLFPGPLEHRFDQVGLLTICIIR